MDTLQMAYRLFAHGAQARTPTHYYGLLALYSLARAAHTGGDEAQMRVARAYLDKYPYQIKHPSYNFDAYRAGGNAQAYLYSIGLADSKAPLLRAYADLTLCAPKDGAGILCMPAHPEKAQIWIDVVTAVTPFLLYIGLKSGEAKYVDFACRQCFLMYDAFMDEECGLLHQARGFLPDERQFSSDHWSRGNGWGLLGLAELVRLLPEGDPRRNEARARLRKHIDALLPWQTARGLWRQEIICEKSWEESSGTGLILYAMGAGLKDGCLPEEKARPAFEKGVKGLADACVKPDFAVSDSCPGCLCPGDGTPRAYMEEKTPYDDEPHGFGAVMLAFVAAHDCGIHDIQWKGEENAHE